MKFVILIVILMSIVNAEISEGDREEKINEVLDDVSDIPAEDKIYAKINDHFSSFFDENGQKFEDVSDISDDEGVFEGIDDVRNSLVNEEGMENIANLTISKDYIHEPASEVFDDPCCYNFDVDEDEMSDDCYDDNNGRTIASRRFISYFTKDECFSDELYIDNYVNTEYCDFPGSKEICKVVFRTCHSKEKGHNRYVTYEITGQNTGRSRSTYNSWRSTNFTVDYIDDLYSLVMQRCTIGHIFGSLKAAKELIKTEDDYYLARGHLAAKCDFDDKSGQDSTYTYFNAAPLFQKINNGNWKSVETQIRNLARKSRNDLKIYSGTHEVGELGYYENDALKMHNIWLELFDTEVKVPMPKLFYKVIIDERQKKGIVLIVVNNPHLLDKNIKTKEYIICDDHNDDKLADGIKWMETSEPWGLKRKDIKRGYVYACYIEKFNEKVKIFNTNPAPNGLLLEISKPIAITKSLSLK